MTISKDRVKPSPTPDSWKLKEIFATGVVLGGYMALVTVIFFWAAYTTDYFPVYNILHITTISLQYHPSHKHNSLLCFSIENVPRERLERQ